METLRSGLTRSVVAAIGVLGGACTTGPEPPESDSVVDSAGIQIVQLEEGAWDPDGRIGLSPDPDVSIGAREGPDDQILYRVSGGLVLGDGRIAILSRGARELRYFGASGVLEGRQGGDGEGPGEYRLPVGLWSLPGDTLVVWDSRLLRATVVSPNAIFTRDIPISGRPRATEVVGVFADGSFAVFRQRMAEEQQSMDQQFQGYYSRYSASGDSLNPLGNFPWMRMITSPPTDGGGGMQAVASGPPIFDAPTRVAATARGLWVGTTKKDELLWISESGTLNRIVRWVGLDRTVTDAVKEAYYDDLRERMAANAPPGEAREPPRGRPFAEILPSHGELVARNDGGLWMKEFLRPGSDPTNRWMILGPEGFPEGIVNLPFSADVLWASPEQVLLLEKDEVDVEYVRLYSFSAGN
jgi:hypothetical protein